MLYSYLDNKEDFFQLVTLAIAETAPAAATATTTSTLLNDIDLFNMTEIEHFLTTTSTNRVNDVATTTTTNKDDNVVTMDGNNDDDDDDDDDNSLSIGSIIGIVIAAIFVVCLIAAGVMWLSDG
jgi:hypothetical protein